MRAFHLDATLDEKTREMLQTYQPLITRDTGLPAEAALQSTADVPQNSLSDEQSKPAPSSDDMGEAEKEAFAKDKRTNNVLLVDDNEMNLRVCVPATSRMCTIHWLQD